MQRKIATLSTTATLFLLTTMISRAGATNTFGGDLNFLRQHTDIVVLRDRSRQSQVIVAPAWQGRVMTSTARGDQGESFGWVNRELIASGKMQPHINVFGGEDRFWLGPEGGQFGLFFAKGVPFDLEHWFTSAVLDTEPFKLVRQSSDRVLCRRQIQITNYSGTTFSLAADREVRLINPKRALALMGGKLPSGVSAVAFESVNTIKNTGRVAWKRDSGLLSIWILGMFNASAESTIVIPFKPGPVSELGPVVNDAYFGKVPANRLVEQRNVLFFRAAANHRCKIGIPPRRVKPVLGSYDAAHHTLTLISFNLPSGVMNYVNSMWELQDHPFDGDVVNSYSDDGKLGNFYELETSSPALALKPGASATHRRQTIHLQGSEKALDAISQTILGVHLDAIRSAFSR